MNPRPNNTYSLSVLRDSHKQAEDIMTTVIVSNCCNGGTLAVFADQCSLTCPPRHELTELVLWRIFADQLDVVTFLHNCTPSLGRTDSHMNNVWLHLPSGSSKSPEVFSGDLGQLEVLDSDIWQPPKPGKPRRLKDYKSLRKVPKCSYYVRCLADDLNHVRVNVDVVSNTQEWSDGYNQCQTAALRQCLQSMELL